MATGGIRVDERTQQIMRLSGVILPVVLTFYGILIKAGIVSSSIYFSDGLFVTLMATWLLVGVFQYLFYSRSLQATAWRVITYHGLAAIYILLISGFAMPFIICWILLILASYAFFSDNGLRLSLMTFVALAAADSILNLDQAGVLVNDLMALLAVLIVAITTVALTKVQEIDGQQLEKSKKDESLQRDSILTLVNNLADAVLSTDRDGKIGIFNAAVIGLLDTNESLAGKNIGDVITLYDENSEAVDIKKLLLQSRGVTVNDNYTTSIGDEEIRLELTYSPIRSSYSRSKARQQEDGYIIILRDVTKSKSLEEERDEFISVVSHELRTPIAIAEGTISNAQVMFERDDVQNKLLREGLKTAHEQVIFLSKMVNDLSTLSRAERGVADEPEEIDVKQMVHDLFNQYTTEAEEKGLKLNLQAEGKLGMVSASRLYLQELIQNFITNSIKYTKEGGVTIDVSVKKNKVLFTVSDTGIGISKADQVKIFKKFYRSEDYRTRETGGTGLGLYVAAKLAKKLGCRIELKSRLNHGSSFSFELPSSNKS